MQKEFRADLHIHSRFARGTSKNLCIRNLAAWACIKGLHVVGTGDFTHPGWRAELERDLVRDEATGLYRSRQNLTDSDLAAEIPGVVFPVVERPLFMLQTEISSIYKKDGRTHRVHNLVFMPDLESVDIFNRKLAAIGNLASDGRPILGLDCEHLLELVLESSDRAVLIPAHIWTPWFSLFGSKSGFDAIEDCFGTLSSHIFALETGLSSDPDMNRLWSALDRYVMVSNSDAHSGANLAREANLFSGGISYDGIFAALCHAAESRWHTLHDADHTADENHASSADASCVYHGTLEFYPEEGKYHFDGHRKCGVVFDPQKERFPGDLCPVCGKPLTVGVMHRVLDLADRQRPVYAADEAKFASLIPLPEILGEILGCGSKSTKVARKVSAMLAEFGSELDILQSIPESDLRQYWDIFGEAITRMRAGHVIRKAGYDGEFGIIHVFSKAEQNAMQSGQLCAVPEHVIILQKKENSDQAKQNADSEYADLSFHYSLSQQHATESSGHPVLVLAGPGSGKTGTLAGRIAYLIQSGICLPEQILAVTFTRRAAGELRERLQDNLAGICADTLHATALAQRQDATPPVILSEEAGLRLFQLSSTNYSARQLRRMWERFSLARERLEPLQDISPDLPEIAARYATIKQQRNALDYTDLLEDWLEALQSGMQTPWREILVDEIQDFSALQLAVIRALLPESGDGFFGIGDPDQSVYGFRGAQKNIPETLQQFWQNLEVMTLRENYRSAPAILKAAHAALGKKSACGELLPTRKEAAFLQEFTAPDAEREALWIADRIKRILGSTSHTLLDAEITGKNHITLSSPCSPGDIAILVRLKSLMPLLERVLKEKGIPCAVPEKEPFWTDEQAALLLGLAEKHFAYPCMTECNQAKVAEYAESIPNYVWQASPEELLTALEKLTQIDTMFRESSAFAEMLHLFRAEGSWEKLLDWVSLRQERDLVRAKAEFVQIMTLHAAKGLEFPVIFMPALEDGILPFAKMHTTADMQNIQDNKDNEDEELRLFYVGLTRAREALFLSHAEKRYMYGKEIDFAESPFLPAVREFFRQSHSVKKTVRQISQISMLHLQKEKKA